MCPIPGQADRFIFRSENSRKENAWVLRSEDGESHLQ